MRILKPTKRRQFNKSIYGIDVETYDNNKGFYCCTIYGDKFVKTFFTREETITELKTKRYQDSYVVATNLQFDFNAIFFGYEDCNFNPLWRGSDMLLQKSYIYNKRFNRKPNKKKRGNTITFIDTLNYAKMSVAQIGKILKIPKLDKPKCIGRLPKNKKEHEEIITYNIRDAEISQKFMKFLFNKFTELGATPKITIASTALSYFKNNFLKEVWFGHSTDILYEQFKGYYGGRTEAFSRGRFKDYHYGDVNSLYPFVMSNSYPHPNSLRVTFENSTRYINRYEGMSHIDIYCPNMEYPFLPLKYEHKLLFPTGNFSGWYTHIELRKAVRLGYVIKKVYKTHYYTRTFNPFKKLINILYGLRKELKANNDPMELVVKLIMNSLYGKFGERFFDKDIFMPMPETAEELNKYSNFEVIGDYVRIKIDEQEPKAHCFPILACYTTAMGRIHLYALILDYKPLYVDTDSIITKVLIIGSKELGGLKIEHEIDHGIIVKPKFYAIKDKKWNVKIKGVGKLLNYKEFDSILDGFPIKYKKFAKMREVLRRKLYINEILDVQKDLDLEDNKRIWGEPFSKYELQHSKPINMDILTAEHKYLNKLAPVKKICVENGSR